MPEEKKEAFATPAEALLTQPPARPARLVTWTLALFAVLAVIYASIARMDVVITAMGRVVPSGKTLLVLAHGPGVIRGIHARDGQRVSAGDLLLEIVPPGTAFGEGAPAAAEAAAALPRASSLAPADGPSQALLDTRLLETLSKLAALDAEVTRRRAERDAVAAVIAELEKSLALVARKHAMREQLARTRHIAAANLIDSKLELINLQKEVYVQRNRLQEAEAALNAAIQSRTQAEAGYKARYPAELVEVVKRTAGVVDDGEAARVQRLRAPAGGILHWLAPLAVGDPVSDGQALVVVVPEAAPLEVEALVLNKDIGHLKVGQHAIVKAETFDYTRYGHFEGTVQWVGVDAIDDARLGPVYAARVALAFFETPNIVNGRRGRLAPGMNVTVDVRVSERRLIEYFLNPLLRYKEESLRER
jgi:hemolysin D